MTGEVLGTLLLSWRISMEFLAPGFQVACPGSVAFEKCMKEIFSSLSLSLSSSKSLAYHVFLCFSDHLFFEYHDLKNRW